MTFQAKKWGWKGMAARLLLVPVLAGTTAGVVAAQGYDRPAERATSPVSSVEKSRALIAQAKQALANGDAAAAETYAKQAQDLKATLAYSETRPETLLAEIAKKKMATGAKVATSTDPKELMKLGRQSLASGQLDQAQDFAYQADRASSSKGLRWGLFEDTPASLMKDVQESRAKADREKAARDIAVGALRYFMLRFSRNRIITFDMEEALAFAGETGPYIQNSVVRARSILAKVAGEGHNVAALLQRAHDPTLLSAWLSTEEGSAAWSLFLSMARTEEAIETAVRTKEPGVMTRHVFQIAQTFHGYYQNPAHSVLRAETEDLRAVRVLVVDLFVRHTAHVASLLGIPIPERM